MFLDAISDAITGIQNYFTVLMVLVLFGVILQLLLVALVVVMAFTLDNIKDELRLRRRP